jgi:uncharacterized membrane protein YGL010W
MRDIGAFFDDYATYHRTKGNKWCHRFGIPLITIAAVVYFILDWRLGALMLIVSAAFYFAGAALPFWVNASLFVVGWILQFVGHSVYEKRQPAFLTNAMHLLVGPLWILNDVVHVVKQPATANQQPATTS